MLDHKYVGSYKHGLAISEIDFKFWKDGGEVKSVTTCPLSSGWDFAQQTNEGFI